MITVVKEVLDLKIMGHVLNLSYDFYVPYFCNFRWNFISLKIEHPLHSPKDLDLDQLRLGCQVIPRFLTAPK